MNPGLRNCFLIAIVVVLGACSGGSNTADGNRSRLGGDERSESKRQRLLDKAARVAERAEARSSGGGLAQGTSARAAGKAPGRSSVSSEIVPAYAKRSATFDDADDDGKKEGLPPDYSEVTRASITGLGKNFRMRLTFKGDVPQEMPDDKTYMTIAFGITGPRNEEGYSFGAQATDEGWSAYAGGKDDTAAFPGKFFVRGNQIDMIVPWSYIRGPRAFEWYSTSSWFSQLANTTHYKVDLAPNEGLAKFPQ